MSGSTSVQRVKSSIEISNKIVLCPSSSSSAQKRREADGKEDGVLLI